MVDERAYDDRGLPWLEAVDDEDEPRGMSARAMLTAILMVLVAAAVVGATFFWLGRRNAETAGAPELIRAEPGPYKVRPADPGGLDVAGESETAFQTSAGEDKDAQLDLGKLPQQPAAPTEGTQRLPPNETREPAEPDEPATAAPSGAPGSVIQLGAYRNAAQAERAWTSLSTRFPSVAAMRKMVVPYSGGFRLRAAASSPDAARAACRALEAGGENCFVAK